MPWTKTEAVGHPLCVNEPDTNPYWKKMSYRWMEQVRGDDDESCNLALT